jgi:hypothetical protein
MWGFGHHACCGQPLHPIYGSKDRAADEGDTLTAYAPRQRTPVSAALVLPRTMMVPARCSCVLSIRFKNLATLPVGGCNRLRDVAEPLGEGEHVGVPAGPSCQLCQVARSLLEHHLGLRG